MKFQSVFLSLFLAIAVTACGQTSNDTNTITEHTTEQVANPVIVDVETFKAKMTLPDAQLIDVRTDAEINSGIIPNAVHMDVMEWSGFVESVKELDPEKPVLVYCKSGGRSNKAATYLSQNGFKEVLDLRGGITNWQKSGEKTVNP